MPNSNTAEGNGSTVDTNPSRSIGYGLARLSFDGNGDKYEMFEVKFLSYLRLQGLHEVVNTDSVNEVDSEKNAQVFSLLVQFLDGKRL